MRSFLILCVFFLNEIGISDILHHDSFLPIIAYTPGAYNTFWQTDVCILNADTISHEVYLYFYSNDNSYNKNEKIDIEALETRCFSNVVKELFNYEGYGLLYTLADDFFAPIGITARVYTRREDGGTYGQTIDDQMFNFSTKTSFLVGIKKNEDFRTNIGISILSYPYSSKIPFKIEIYDKDKFIKTYSINVDVPGVFQLPVDVNVDCGFAKIIPEYENVVYLGYISVVDNKTGDAIFIPGKDLYEK